MQLKKIHIFILFFMLYLITAAYEFQEGIIELSINDFAVEESFPAYFREDRSYPFLEIEEFFFAAGITSYEISENSVAYSLNGEKIIQRVDLIPMGDTHLFYPGERDFPGLEGDIEWDSDLMILSVHLPYMLPDEFLLEQERRRRRLADLEDIHIIEEEWKLFTPGVLNLGYGKSDIEEGDDLLSLNYVNQFLYGASELNVSVEEGDLEVDTYRWRRYTESGRKIVLGDSYVSNPSDLGDSPSFRGVSIFRRNSWDTSQDVNSKRVTGFAPNGSTAELYENGILKEYQIVRNGSYEFDIETTGGSRYYEVWIYKQDGEIEKKPVSVYGTTDLLNAGEIDYELQAGQDRDNSDYNPYRADIFYGLTEDFTLKVGGYNAGEDDKKENYLNISPLFRIGSSGRWSHFIAGDFSLNTSEKREKFYRGEIRSGNGTISNTIGYERYRNFDDFFIGESYDEKFLWKLRFPVMDINSSLSYEYERDRFDREKLHRYGLTMYDSFFRGKVSASMSLTREDLRREASSDETTTETGLSLSYSITHSLIGKLIDTVGVEYDGESSAADTYGFYLQRRSRRNRSLEYYLRVRKEKGDTFGELSVTYRFGEKLNIRSYNYKNRDDSTTHGFDINTAVNFAAPKDKIYYSDYMGDSNVRGSVFIDTDNDGRRGPGDRGVPSFIIKNSSREWSSDEEGMFFMPLLSSGTTHRLKIKNKNDDILNYYFLPEYNIKTLPGGDLTLDIPIIPLKSLVGMIEFSEELYMEEVQDILKNTSIEITSLRDGSRELIRVEDEYFIRELPSGNYTLNIFYKGGAVLSPYHFEITSDDEYLEEYIDIRISGEKRNDYTFEVIP